ncbi:hypothetical protein TNCV_2085451 [Trichonephila clavipes]|uniref:Uncharacterized protein n=1 Tax=Trichonephila clavipes TaxID=2585209 RepID=A0A8X6RKQ1_TRICX|nr:hypothetical protein TNCV_2085451 [Trichonephila clavipes]
MLTACRRAWVRILEKAWIEVPNIDQEVNLSLAIVSLDETHESCPQITNTKLFLSYEDGEFEITKKVQINSDDSIISTTKNTDAISSGMDTKISLKKFSPFTQRRNISGSSEQIPAFSSETTLIKGTQYTFYDDNGEKFIIDNADFEEEEEELIDIFNSNLAFVSKNSKFEM